MASIEAMIKEASRSLVIRVKRQGSAAKELEAAQDMDRRAVARLDAAEKAVTKLDTEVNEKAGIVARLTDRPVEDVLAEIRAELDAESGETASDESAPADESATGDVSAPAPKVSKAKAKATQTEIPATV